MGPTKLTKLFSILILMFVTMEAVETYLEPVDGCCYDFPGYLTTVRNESGSIISKTGISVEMMQWLSQELQLAIDCIPVMLRTVENTTAFIGSMHYFLNGKCSLVVGPTLLRNDRFQLMDYLNPSMFDPASMLIPTPDVTSLNISAVWKPFQFPVWIALVICIIMAAIALMVLKRIRGEQEDSTSTGYWMFVIAIIFSQAGSFSSGKFRLRLVGGAWCLVAFVLVTAYSSVLTSFITAPYTHPLVETVEEVADKSNVKLVTVRGLALDIILSRQDSPLNKRLLDKLNSWPDARCVNGLKCLDLVKLGSSVWIQDYGGHIVATREDFRSTGKCSATFAKENFANSFPAGWGITKKNPKREGFNRGTLRMQEAGLFSKWKDQYQPKPYQCFLSSRRKGSGSLPPRLTLQNLTGAFCIILLGYVVSALSFISEITFTRCFVKKY